MATDDTSVHRWRAPGSGKCAKTPGGQAVYTVPRVQTLTSAPRSTPPDDYGADWELTPRGWIVLACRWVVPLSNPGAGPGRVADSPAEPQQPFRRSSSRTALEVGVVRRGGATLIPACPGEVHSCTPQLITAATPRTPAAAYGSTQVIESSEHRSSSLCRASPYGPALLQMLRRPSRKPGS